MADLAVGELTTGTSPFKPVSPTVDRSAEPLVRALDTGITAGVNSLIGFNEAKVEKEQAGYLQGFREEMILVADAVDQGVMSSDQGLSRMRQNYLKYTSNNPMMAAEVQKTYDQIITSAGLGKEVAEGTAEEQAFEALKSDAIADGWIREGDSPDVQEEAINLYLDDKQAKDQLARLQAQASYDSTLLGIESSQMSLNRSRQQVASQRALTQLATTQTPRFRNEMNRIITDYRTGAITQEEALQLAQDQSLTVETFLSQVGVDAGGEYINNLASPINTIYENTVKMLKGEDTLANLNRKNDTAIAIATAGWLEDPTRASIVAGSRLFPNSEIVDMAVRTSPAVINYLGGFGREGRPTVSPMPLTDTDKEGFKNYTGGVLKPNINLYLNNNLSEEATAELDRSISGMINAIPAYAGSADSVGDYQPLVDFLADPTSFGRYAEKRGGIPSDSVAQAKAILGEQYEFKVVDLIKNEWKSAVSNVATVTSDNPERIGTITVDSREVPDVIEPVFTGGGVAFRLKRDVPPNVEYNRILSKLNQRVSPALNKLVRLGAHFNGTRDYKGEYDANFADIFGFEQQTTEE